MRPPSTFAALLAVLACGATSTPAATTADPPESAPDDPSSPPAAIAGSPESIPARPADRSSPAATTVAYLNAAIALEFEDMHALMTPACSNEERSWDKGLTRNLADGRIRVRAYEVGQPEITADTAQVTVQAELVADAVEPERVHFDLQRDPDGWAIVAIR